MTNKLGRCKRTSLKNRLDEAISHIRKQLKETLGLTFYEDAMLGRKNLYHPLGMIIRSQIGWKMANFLKEQAR